MVLWECQSRSLTNIVRNNSSSLELQTQHDGSDGNVTPSSMVEKSIIGYSFGKCNGVMGVPITFLDKYCPEQFEIIKFRHGDDGKDLCVNGKCPYFRILIRRK